MHTGRHRAHGGSGGSSGSHGRAGYKEEMSRGPGPDLAPGRGEDQQAGCFSPPRLLGEAPLFGRPGPRAPSTRCRAARRGPPAGPGRTRRAGRRPDAHAHSSADAGPGPPPPRPGPRSRAFQDGRAGCHLGLPGNSAAASPRARAVTNAAPPSRAMDTTRLPVSGTRGLPRERRGTLTRSQGLEPPDHGGDTRHPPRTPPPPPGRPSRSLPAEAVTREDSLSWALPGAPAPQARGTPSLPRTRPCSSQPPSAAPRTPQPPRRLPSVTTRPRPRRGSPRLAVHSDGGRARGPTAARPAGMGSSDARRGSGCSMSPSFTGARPLLAQEVAVLDGNGSSKRRRRGRAGMGGGPSPV